MVWSQYIEDGNYDLDVELDESGEVIVDDDDVHLNIHDWQSKYSDELWMLWDMTQELIRAAFLERVLLDKGTYAEFVEFCYHEHHEEPMYLYCPVTPHLLYIWRKLKECVDDMHLADVLMVGATVDHFLDFVAMHTSQNNITVY